LHRDVEQVRQSEGRRLPLRASQGSASHPAIIIGKDKDSGKADAVLAPN
jgi:hypothetical protein